MLKLNGFDKSLAGLAQSYMEEECGRLDDAERHYLEVVEAIKEDSAFSFGRNGTGRIDASSCDLYDRVSPRQKEILLAYVNKDDATILAIMKQLCHEEIESIVDLVFG